MKYLFPLLNMAEQGDIVVVTGGNGFVGQHIIKLLHEHCQNEIKEIRVFDIKAYSQNLDYKPTIPVKSIKGDIGNLQDFSRAAKGANCVIHVAGMISFGTHPNVSAMKAVNVDGTNIVIEACLMNNVKRLVQTSSVDVATPLRDCDEKDEDSLPYLQESELAIPEYASTKMKAEKLVLGSHGRPLANGSGLFHTVSVRPTGMYGELDVSLIAHSIRRAASRGGVATFIAPKKEKQGCIHDITYVGNVAWGHICAMRALRDNPDVCGGKPYIITDDTPRLTIVNHTSPFLHARGYRMANFQIPYKLAYYVILILQTLLMLLRPIRAFNLPISLKTLDYINYNYTFRRTKATNDLGYRPLFTHEESMKKATEYYKNMKV